MEIEFKVRTNKSYPMIRTACFNMKNGFQIKVDRNRTEYNEPTRDGTMEMVWKDCYLWAIDGNWLFDDRNAILDGIDAVKFFKKNTQSVEFEIEDDAPSNYVAVIQEWECY